MVNNEIYPRDLVKKIEPFLDRREFIGVVGPRQSGKTTLLNIMQKHLREKLEVKEELMKIVTFEDRRQLIEFESDPLAYINSWMPENSGKKFYLMLDEFQYVESGGQKLKLIYDTIENIKIIITGSSSLEIKGNIGKYMVGRLLSFKLYPFNFGEFLRVKNERLERIYRKQSNKIRDWMFDNSTSDFEDGYDTFHNEMVDLWEEFCIWGGYPAVVITERDGIRKKLLSEIYNNYILKDIKTLLELSTENNLYKLSQYLATQIGSIIVYKNLSQKSGLNYRKLKKHINILKETFICNEVKPFFKNRQKELSKNPKIYFIDTGFRNNLMQNFNSLNLRSKAGALVENAVFIKLLRLNGNTEKINFWRKKAGAEVDFIMHIKDGILPIEVKYSNFSENKIPSGLISLLKIYNPDKALVLTKNYWGSIKYRNTKLLFVPVYYL